MSASVVPRSLRFQQRAALLSIGAAIVFGLAAACSTGPDAVADSTDPQAEPPAPGALRGELVIYTATYDDGTTDDRYALRVGNDETDERPLLFVTPPDVPGGSRIDVWGTSSSDGLHVARWTPVRGPRGSIESAALPLITGAPLKPRSFAFVLVDLGAGVNITADEAKKRLFGTDAMATPSVRQYFMEASYGRQDVAGEVFGPFPYTMTGCNTRALTTALRAMIPGTFDHYLWYLGSRVASCGWSGLASSGSVAKPSRDTWYNASAGCVVLVQEPGHNFGMDHSSSMKCPNASFIDVPDQVCVHSEYGDSYDPMGRGCHHMNGAQKAYLGWYDKCNVVEVTQSGSYTLLPTELPCDGTQVLMVAMPKPRPFFRSGGGGSNGITELTYYYLELRVPFGMDKGLGTQVQIRASMDMRPAAKKAGHTWFLDMNPATTALDGLVAGGSFTDPAGGIKFTVTALDNNSATVNIEIPGGTGGAKCLDGTALAGPGPGPESCGPAPFSIVGAAPPYVPPRDGGASTAMPDPGNGGGGGRRDAGGGNRDAGGSGSGNGSADAGTRGGDNPNVPPAGGGKADAGTGSGATPGSGSGSGGAGAGNMGGSGAPASGAPAVAGGCSCRMGTAGAGDVPGGLVPAAAFGLLGLVQRRRRRRSR